MHNPEKSEKGKTVDFLLCAKRDIAAAEDFSGGGSKARGGCRAPSHLMITRLRMAVREILSQHQRRERPRKLYQSFFSGTHYARNK